MKQQNEKDKDKKADDDVFPGYVWLRPIPSTVEQRESHVVLLGIVKPSSFSLAEPPRGRTLVLSLDTKVFYIISAPFSSRARSQPNSSYSAEK